MTSTHFLIIVAVLGSRATAVVGEQVPFATAEECVAELFDNCQSMCPDGKRFRAGCVEAKYSQMFRFVRAKKLASEFFGDIEVSFVFLMESTFLPASLATLSLLVTMGNEGEFCDGPTTYSYAFGRLFSDMEVVIGLDGRISSINPVPLSNDNVYMWNLLFDLRSEPNPILPGAESIGIPGLIYDFDSGNISIGVDSWPVFLRSDVSDLAVVDGVIKVTETLNGGVDGAPVVFQPGDPCADSNPALRRKLTSTGWLHEDVVMINIPEDLSISDVACPVGVCLQTVGSCESS